MQYIAYPVAASAYPEISVRNSQSARHTHIVKSDVTFMTPLGVVLCHYVKVENILQDGSLAAAPETATCPECSRRYARLVAK